MSSGQRWGVTGGWRQELVLEELFPQQLERVKRVLPLARFPMGGLQAWSTHLETDAEGDVGENIGIQITVFCSFIASDIKRTNITNNLSSEGIKI